MSPNIRTTGAIVAAFVANNHLDASEVDRVLHDVHAKISDIAGAKKLLAPIRVSRAAVVAVAEADPTQSVLICRECGKQFKSLKLHLRRSHGLSAQDYRERHSLPRDYCFISLDYSVERSRLVGSFRPGRFLASQN